MEIEEKGVVLEARGDTALVRAVESSHCSGCAAAGSCHTGAGRERIVEVENAVGAKAGETVIMSVPSAALLKASFQVYMIPVLGVLAGAGIAQAVVQSLAGPEAGGMAAGLGGFAGAVLSVAAMRIYRKKSPGIQGLRPRIVRIAG